MPTDAAFEARGPIAALGICVCATLVALGLAERVPAQTARRSGQATTTAAQRSRLVGVWRLNVLTSTLPGAPPKSQTVSFSATGPDDIAGVEDTFYSDGTRSTIKYTAKLDGRDYPIAGPDDVLARTDAISMRSVDASKIVWTYKKSGAVVLTLPGTISSDGRTLTMTAPDNVVLIYEKQ